MGNNKGKNAASKPPVTLSVTMDPAVAEIAKNLTAPPQIDSAAEENLFADGKSHEDFLPGTMQELVPGELLEFAPVQLKVKKLREDAQLPQYQTDGAACFDLHALDPKNGQHDGLIAVAPGRAMSFHTGLAVEVPEGYVMLAFSRSGHGFKAGVRLANCVGVIDSDFRGEIMVRLQNDGKEKFDVCTGDRIAQAMLLPVPRVELVEVEELSETARGEGGYGSTGK